MLILTNLVGFATGNRAKSYQYMGSDSDASNGTSYTFTGKSLGRSAARKYVVVAVTVRISAGAAGGITAVSVGGNSATQVVQTADQATQPVVGLYIVDYSGNANETGNITITTSQASIGCAIAWYSLYNYSSMTAHATSSSTASPISLSYNLPANGMCVAVSGNSTTSTATWGGTPVENYDVEYDAGVTASGASNSVTAAAAEVTTCTWTAYNNPKGVAASFA
jgi:hypothetical protein